MTVTTEDRNRQNIFAYEPRMYIDHNYLPFYRIIMNEKAELLNGRAAMIGFIAAIGAYIVTGDIIPGLF